MAFNVLIGKYFDTGTVKAAACPRLLLAGLALLLASCDTGSGQRWEISGTSANGEFTVTAWPTALSSGEAIERPVIGAFHSWLVQLQDEQEQAVTSAALFIDGGMPAHGHGLPSSPQVSAHLGDGLYRIDGMQFNMPGSWLLRFSIQGEHASDTADIAFELQP